LITVFSKHQKSIGTIAKETKIKKWAVKDYINSISQAPAPDFGVPRVSPTSGQATTYSMSEPNHTESAEAVGLEDTVNADATLKMPVVLAKLNGIRNLGNSCHINALIQLLIPVIQHSVRVRVHFCDWTTLYEEEVQMSGSISSQVELDNVQSPPID
jgi:hypothetical protein